MEFPQQPLNPRSQQDWIDRTDQYSVHTLLTTGPGLYVANRICFRMHFFGMLMMPSA